MQDKDSTEALLSESRKLRDLFNEVISPHRQSLWQYCLRLTSSPWDAEDLLQETLTKAFATLPQLWNPLVPKSYLFRIATNTWIDTCRKQRVVLDVLEEESVSEDRLVDPLEVREAIEVMMAQLPPKQMVVLLLMDVFEFPANEVAGILYCSTGSVYAALRRARGRLRELRQSDEFSGRLREPGFAVQEMEPSNVAVKRVIKALNHGDVQEFLAAMSKHVHNDAAPGFQEFGKQEVQNQSGQGLPANLRAACYRLWGRDVIVVVAETDAGPALHNVAYPVTEGEKIVYFRGYYFCKELLMEVGRVLNLPVQMDKGPANWDTL